MKIVKENSIANVKLDLCEYKNIIPIDDYIFVSKDNKCGMIDYSGNVIFDPIYHKINKLDDGYFILEDFAGNYYLGTKDHIYNISCGGISYLGNNMFFLNTRKIIYVDNEKKSIEIIKDNVCNCIKCKEDLFIINIYPDFVKKGIMDSKGNEIIKNEYDYIEFLDDKYICALKNGKYGIINLETKKEVIPFKYDYKINKFTNSYFICMSNSNTKIIDKNNDVLFKIKAHILSPLKNGFALVGKTFGQQVGVIDMFGNIVLPLKYNVSTKDCLLFKDFFILRNYNQLIVINNKKESKYDIVDYTDELYIVKKYGKYGVISKENGKFIFDVEHQWIIRHTCEDGKNIFIVKDKDKYKLFDSNLNKIKDEYDSITEIKNSKDYFIVDSKFGRQLLSINGKIFSFNYKNIKEFSNNHFIVYDNESEKLGLIDVNGYKVLDTIYDDIKVYDKYIVVLCNGLYKLFDIQGNIILDNIKNHPKIENNTLIIDNKTYNLDNISLEYKLLLYNTDNDLVKEKVYDEEEKRNKYYDLYNEELKLMNKRIKKYERKQKSNFKKDFFSD